MKKILFLSLFLLGFQVLFAQVPTITSFSPTQGPIGTIDTINGTNFSTIPVNNIVFYGAVRALVIASTTNQIIARVPLGATQPLTVTVKHLTAYSLQPFIVTFNGGNIDSTSFASKVDFLTDYYPYSLNIDDIDGDGKPDIAVSIVGSKKICNYSGL